MTFYLKNVLKMYSMAKYSNYTRQQSVNNEDIKVHKQQKTIFLLSDKCSTRKQLHFHEISLIHMP